MQLDITLEGNELAFPAIMLLFAFWEYMGYNYSSESFLIIAAMSLVLSAGRQVWTQFRPPDSTPEERVLGDE